MSEYRATIGRFACVAEYASYRLRRKLKKARLTKTKNAEREENIGIPDSTKIKESFKGSLDRWETRSKSQTRAGQRSKSLNHQREGRSRIRKPLLSRTKSESLIRGRKRKTDIVSDNFKFACVACKTDMFDQSWQRGRATRNLRQTLHRSKEEMFCPHAEKGSTRGTFIATNELCFLTCVALSECIMLERALIAVLKMALVRSGIETNPGPTNEIDSPCCNASQHFNRVKNTMAKAQTNFQSKVTTDTLSKKVIQIEETGNYGSMIKL